MIQVNLRQFGGDEEVLSLAYSLFEALLQSLSNLPLIEVHLGAVDVPISILQGNLHSCSDFSWLGLPCARERERERERERGMGEEAKRMNQ